MNGCVVQRDSVSDAEREVLELEQRLEEARNRLNGLQVRPNDDAVARLPAPKPSPPPTGMTTITPTSNLRDPSCS